MTTNDTTARKGADDFNDEIKYKLLSNTRRRAVVEELHDHEPLTKSELADKLTERVDETPSGQERKRIYISLHQQHIPKLMKHSVILEGGDGYVLGQNAEILLDEMGHPPHEEETEPENDSEGVESPEEPENRDGENGGLRGRLSGMLGSS